MEKTIKIEWVENGYIIQVGVETFVCERDENETIKAGKLPAVLDLIVEKYKKENPIAKTA